MQTKRTPVEWEKRLRAVQEAALMINEELSIDRVLQKIVDVARGIIDCRYAALGVLNESGTGLARFITSGMSPEVIAAMPHYPRGLGLLGSLFQESQPVRVKRISEDSRSIGFPPHHPPMTSFLGVRITSRGKLFGNFYMTDKVGAEEFSQEDEDLLVMFAAHAGIAIDNARLYTQTSEMLQQKVQEVERSERQARFMVELGDLLIGTSLGEDLPLRQIAEKATEILGDASVMVQVDPENSEKIERIIAYHSDPARQQAAESFIQENWNTLKEIVLDKHESVFMANASVIVLPYKTIDPSALLKHKFSALIALPVRSREKVYGVGLSLASQPRMFSEFEFSLAALIAERLGIAIENAFLYRDLKEALNLRDEFLSIASHELRSPVTALKGYVQILESDRPVTPEVRQKALSVIERQSNRLVQLVEQLLDVSRIRVGRLELQIESTDFVELADDVAERFRIQFEKDEKYRLLVTHSSPSITGDCDRGRMEQVFSNLISNAIKYSPNGGTISVNIESLDDAIHASISDQGIGIPKDQQEYLFEMFTRASNVQGRGFEGMGLGLYICKEIVERHGGKIWIESQVGQGSTFHFTIPKAHPMAVEESV